MSYKELADSLRKKGGTELPSEDIDVVRAFSPNWLSERLLDIIVARSSSLSDFNLHLKRYCGWPVEELRTVK
jgi:hypothetical protein